MKKTNEEIKFTPIRVIDESQTFVTEHADESDDWDRDNTMTTHYIRGIQIVEEKGYKDLEVPFEVVRDKDYYLLYVLYGTGDSFGHDDGNIELIGLYQTHEAAEKNAKAIRAHYEAQRNNYSSSGLLYLTTESGNKFELWPPWIGYFESLEDIVVKSVRLGDSRY